MSRAARPAQTSSTAGGEKRQICVPPKRTGRRRRRKGKVLPAVRADIRPCGSPTLERGELVFCMVVDEGNRVRAAARRRSCACACCPSEKGVRHQRGKQESEALRIGIRQGSSTALARKRELGVVGGPFERDLILGPVRASSPRMLSRSPALSRGKKRRLLVTWRPWGKSRSRTAQASRGLRRASPKSLAKKSASSSLRRGRRTRRDVGLDAKNVIPVTCTKNRHRRKRSPNSALGERKSVEAERARDEDFPTFRRRRETRRSGCRRRLGPWTTAPGIDGTAGRIYVMEKGSSWGGGGISQQ